MQRLIIDLRWNAGGHLDQAVKLASKFIDGDVEIVHTEGRIKDFNEIYYANTFERKKVRDYPLIILINNASASASEIVAGAIQDYDRGVIAGTVSFGKGLVQREFPLPDDSRLRLTVSKYYTPSGRLIQRPYKNKNIREYYEEALDSAAVSAEKDSLRQKSVFFTRSGRKVYGGGGIEPDVHIEYTGNTKSPHLVSKMNNKRIYFEVASHFAAQNQYLKNDFGHFLKEFKVDNKLLTAMKERSIEKGITIDPEEFNRDREYITSRLKAEIARALWDSEKYYHVLIVEDNQYREALKLFDNIDSILSVNAN